MKGLWLVASALGKSLGSALASMVIVSVLAMARELWRHLTGEE